MIKLTKRQKRLDAEANIHLWERYALAFAAEILLLIMLVGLIFPVLGFIIFFAQAIVMVNVERKERRRFKASAASASRIP